MQSYIFYRNFAEKNYLCAMQLNAITRKSTLMATILLAVIVVAAVLRYWFAPFSVEVADSGAHESAWLVVISVFLYMGNALLQEKILSRSGLASNQCSLPIPIYGLLACGIFVAPDMAASSIASLCFAVAIYLLLRSLQSIEETDSVFFASILLGATALLYPPCIVLAAVIPIAVVTLALSLRQALLMIVGYMVPLFVTSYIVWYRGGGFFDVCNKLFSALALPQMSEVEGTPYLAITLATFVGVLTLWGIIHSLVRPTKALVLMRVRRAFYFFLLVTLSVSTIILLPACDLAACAVIAVPMAIMLSFVLDVLPNVLSTIAYWTLLVLFFVHLFVA